MANRSFKLFRWNLGQKKVVRTQKLTDEEATTQRKVDAQYRKSKEQQKTQVGNFVGTLGAVSLLAAIHGDDKDGSPKKKRKYARRGQKLLDISQSVAVHGLKEAADAGEDVSSNEMNEFALRAREYQSEVSALLILDVWLRPRAVLDER